MRLRSLAFASMLVVLMKGCDCAKCITYWQTVITDKASCVDKHALCQNWFKNGECTKNPDYMMPNCCSSCSSCQDKRIDCERWAKVPQQCTTAVMKKGCRKSCGQCTVTTKRKVKTCEVATEKCVPKPVVRGSPSYASSQLPNFQAHRARIGGGNGWCAGLQDKKPFLNLDLRSVKEISEFDIQGTNTNPLSFVKSFKLAYSKTGTSWIFHSEYANRAIAQVFDGNWDGNTIRKYKFINVFEARYVRIYPQEWQNYACLRLEIYGC
ncbi:lactadherin-like [Hydractinia symbiolongicarpus]|uniref:lactadherin-like n=1 Tax=Hydractinia symbiolongicarpus TaxID=13093 RepID=UPI00254FBC9F|nr:lactadherin-like [Hydractinia symbiolongicarpus]